MACKTEVEPPIGDDVYEYEYFPLAVGQSRTYQVDSIRFDYGEGNFMSDSSSFYIREDYVEMLENQEGNDLYRIERRKAKTLEGPWQVLDVVSEFRTVTQAFRTENNLKFNVLVFPPEEGTRWDGNAYLNEDLTVFVRGEPIQMFKFWDYEVLSKSLSATVGEMNYTDLLHVQQAEDVNAFDLRQAFEYYAKDIGAVYRERWILESACKFLGRPEICVGRDWPEKSGRGFIVRETLVAHQ